MADFDKTIGFNKAREGLNSLLREDLQPMCKTYNAAGVSLISTSGHQLLHGIWTRSGEDIAWVPIAAVALCEFSRKQNQIEVNAKLVRPDLNDKAVRYLRNLHPLDAEITYNCLAPELLELKHTGDAWNRWGLRANDPTVDPVEYRRKQTMLKANSLSLIHI